MVANPALTLNYQVAGSWGPVRADSINIFPSSLTTSEWLYHCGPIPERIRKRPWELIMTSNSLANGPLNLEHDQVVDWGLYILSMLPQELQDNDLWRQEREEIRDNINLETGDSYMVARLNKLASWLWDQREARAFVCWPNDEVMRYIRSLASYTDGVANLFASDVSLEKAHAGWNAVPWTIDSVSLTVVHCLDSKDKFFKDVAIVLAKSTVTSGWKFGTTRIRTLREFLVKHHDPFLKAVGMAVLPSYTCSDGDRCRQHLLLGKAYLPKDWEDLLAKIRKAIGAGLTVCLKRGRVEMSNAHVYIDMGKARALADILADETRVKPTCTEDIWADLTSIPFASAS
ncbi:hypothetical protein L249_1225 [Ophiocordyceps polyrhachis-furcata BCC 54312]|uniref:Uncharacterized protein n=1 Tax=Ophiocordyceps polyrhachis-furcata BCC 54312 TaxID=1330021 RepID=A0A367LG38_9HYPO|nr:hypothetical protein L249_1225 [Ophiocordyceps polyrhachis-furcata BCC 54312]